MSISKKMYLLVSCATMISMTSFCSEEAGENPRKTQDSQEQPQALDLVPQARFLSDTYNYVFDKCKPLYNPVAIASVAASSAALGLKKLGIVGATGMLIANSELIIAAGNGYIERVKEDNLKAELEKAK
jgi:hypothetical protein